MYTIEYKGEIVTAELSNQVKEFIANHIHAVWQLDLLVLFRNHGHISLNEVSRLLYMEPLEVEATARTFASAGILTSERDAYRYAPRDNYMSDDIDETVRMYSQRRIAVINCIYAASLHFLSEVTALKREED